MSSASITGLASLAADLRTAAIEARAAYAGEARAALAVSARKIAAATARTAISHPHLADRYGIVAAGPGWWNLVNDTIYLQPYLVGRRVNAAAAARQAHTNQVIDQEVASLEAALAGAGVSVLRRIAP